MDKVELQDFSATLRESMPVSVVMEKKPSNHAWIDFTYQAIGVVPSEHEVPRKVTRIYTEEGVEHYLFSGLSLKLHVDECESYYHNLMSPEPGCFVVASEADDDSDMPVPYLVSLCFDEVHAYLEGDEHIYAVEIPPQLYKWTEAFILTNYVAIKKTKRKLTDWKQRAGGQLTLHHDDS